MNIHSITNIDNQKHIAILDTCSVSFLQNLNKNGVTAEKILYYYDLILIPGWVLKEIEDSEASVEYLSALISTGFPIYKIDEKDYSSMVDEQELNLFKIVQASTSRLGAILQYLNRNVKRDDPLDMDLYKEWIDELYKAWPIPGETLRSGRAKKKNAGEISITILTEVLSWYHQNSESITVYSQDCDTREFVQAAEERLRNLFDSIIPIPVSYKSNDAIFCQLFRSCDISEEQIRILRKGNRNITYSKEMEDKSITVVTELIDIENFIKLLNDKSIHIIF